MNVLRLRAGAEVDLDGRPVRLVEKVDVDGRPAWLVRCLRDGVGRTIAVADLHAMYTDADRLALRVDPGEGTEVQRAARARRARLARADLPEAARVRGDTRKKFLRMVAERSVPGAMHAALPAKEAGGERRTVLEAILADVSAELGRGRPVSPATYYRWLKLGGPDGDDPALMGDHWMTGNRNQSHPRVKSIALGEMRRLLDEGADQAGVGKAPGLSMKRVKRTIEKRLGVERERDPERAGELALPSDATLYNWWNLFPAFDRAVAKRGRAWARHQYRHVRGRERPEAAFDVVEYDETTLPFYFFDEEHQVPLGRATLSWFVCTYSHAVGGFYVGFEPAGDLVMMSAMRHCCTPKTYMKTEYGDAIQHPWLMCGLPRKITVDNSRPAWGKSAAVVADALDIDWDWAPVRTPWFKPIVEGMFKLLNESLLRDLPGFVLPREIDRSDYDPAKNGCIGLRHFVFILHKWLAEEYHARPQDWLGCSPNQRWIQGTRDHEPGLLPRGSDLKRLFGVVREGRLDHRGLVYENLWYREGLEVLRRRSGHALTVQVKIDPSDLGCVHVFDKSTETWLPAAAERRAYATGLSLHRHLLVRKHTVKKHGRDDEALYEQGARDLHDFIARALQDAAGIRARTLMARAQGVGTQHLFGNLDHDGRLGPLTGPFAGQALNPLAPQGRAALPPPAHAPAASPAASDAADVPAARAAHSAEAVPRAPDRADVGRTAAIRPRQRRVFTADLSLSATEAKR